MGLRIICKYCRRIFPRKSKRNKFNIKTFDFFLKIIYIINADFIGKAELAFVPPRSPRRVKCRGRVYPVLRNQLFAPPRSPRRVKCRGKYAGMAELADASDSGSDFRKEVQVQVLLPAPKENGTQSGYRSFLSVISLRWSRHQASTGSPIA